MSDHKPKKEEEKKEGAEGAEGAEPKKGGKKKLVIMIVGGVLLVGGIVGGLVAGGIIGGGEEKEEGEKKEGHGDAHGKAKEGHGEAKGGHGEAKEGAAAVDEHGNPLAPAYVDLPNIVVNLSSPSGRTHFANIKIALELASKEDAKLVEDSMPKIQDSLITYLRDIRKEDLDGSAGTERLKAELQNRFDKVLGAGKVKSIFFKEIVVQ